MQCTVKWSPETGTGLVKPLQQTQQPLTPTSKYKRGSHWKANKKDKMEDEERRERRRRQRQKVVGCCKKVATFAFSHIGLATLVVLYSIAGGFLFRALEAPFEAREKIRIMGERDDAVSMILNEAYQLKMNDPTETGNFTGKVRAILLNYQAEVVSAVKDSGWDGNDNTGGNELQWSFAGALLYAVTVITTIGYGHIAPKTDWGRLVTILYALVGIPLTFLYLSNIGNFLADSFRLFYKKVCCDICCCQQCERKKKLERMRRRRELAAQRNFEMNSSPPIIGYGAHDETGPINNDAEHDEFYIENELPRLGLPGGDENMGFEEDASQSEDEDSTDGSRNKSRRANCNNLREPSIRETAILGDDYLDDDEIRETAILDDDVDEVESRPPSRKPSKKIKVSSTSSDLHVSTGILDKLGNARETDILDDSDDNDGYENLATLSPHSNQTKSLSDSQLKATGSIKQPKGEIKRAKSLKDKLKTKNRESKKDKGKDSKDRSPSRSTDIATAEREGSKKSKKKKVPTATLR